MRSDLDSTMAAFLTTTPGTSIANWLHPVPYILLLGAFCLAYLAVGTGIFLLFILMDVRSQSLRVSRHTYICIAW